MWSPQLDAVIERRLLFNYRADPGVVAKLLPAPFRPQLRGDVAVVGICLLRLGHARPAGLPGVVGLGSENAAHRVAVEWDTPEGARAGVFIFRRDSGSRLNTVVGGRLFPGVHHRATFDVTEDDERLRVAYATADGSTAVDVEVTVTPSLGASALFDDAAEASEFFRLGSAGYSPARQADRFDGLELAADGWQIDPCRVERAASSFYDDRAIFPVGTIEQDCALVMRQVPVRWSSLAPLRAG